MANGAVRKAKDGEVEQLERHCKEQGRIFELVAVSRERHRTGGERRVE